MVGKRKKRSSNKTLLVMVTLVFGAVALLGSLRFQASRLEYFLNTVNKNIERYSTEELELKQTFPSLASPIKIYSYCKDMLGMSKVKGVETVRVDAERVVTASRPESQKGWRSSVRALFGFAPH